MLIGQIPQVRGNRSPEHHWSLRPLRDDPLSRRAISREIQVFYARRPSTTGQTLGSMPLCCRVARSAVVIPSDCSRPRPGARQRPGTTERSLFHTRAGCLVDKTVMRRFRMLGRTALPLRSAWWRLQHRYQVDDFINRLMIDPRLNSNPWVDEAHHRVPPAGFKYLVTEMVCWATGGPQKYTGKSMAESHKDLKDYQQGVGSVPGRFFSNTGEVRRSYQRASRTENYRQQHAIGYRRLRGFAWREFITGQHASNSTVLIRSRYRRPSAIVSPGLSSASTGSNSSRSSCSTVLRIFFAKCAHRLRPQDARSSFIDDCLGRGVPTVGVCQCLTLWDARVAKRMTRRSIEACLRRLRP